MRPSIIAATAAFAIAAQPGMLCAETAAHPPPASHPPASPHAIAGNREVRCLMLSNLFAKATTVAQAQMSAGQARLYYLGRVSAKLSPAQLEPAMSAEARTIDPDKAGPEMNKCVETMQASAAAVEAAGHEARAAIGPAKP